MQLKIILVRPQMGENIGSTARIMANFGLGELVLVAPRDGWPNPKASDMAGKALNILDDARVVETVSEAVADCQFVLATTSRERAMQLPVVNAREAMMAAREKSVSGQKVAILFGPERTGLENEDVTLADSVVSIPVSPVYPSLNIAQAVAINAYEWFMSAAPATQTDAVPPADKAALEGLFGHLEGELDTVNFWNVPEKKPVMWRNIRASLTRAGLSAQEVQTWRGIIKMLSRR